MQRLNRAGLVQSSMGVKGGFELSRDPTQINLLEIIETIQGTLSVNRCVLGKNACKNQSSCPVCVKLGELQGEMTNYLNSTSLQDIIDLGD